MDCAKLLVFLCVFYINGAHVEEQTQNVNQHKSGKASDRFPSFPNPSHSAVPPCKRIS